MTACMLHKIYAPQIAVNSHDIFADITTGTNNILNVPELCIRMVNLKLVNIGPRKY